MTTGSGAAGAFLLGGEDAAAEQRDAHEVEIVRRDHVGEQAASGVAFGEADHREVVGRETGEDAVLATQIDEVGVGEGAVAIGFTGIAAVEPYEFLGLVDGQGFQQEGIDEAENRGIGADAESQHQHGGCGESRVSWQVPGCRGKNCSSVHLQMDFNVQISSASSMSYATGARKVREMLLIVLSKTL